MNMIDFQDFADYTIDEIEGQRGYSGSVFYTDYILFPELFNLEGELIDYM